MYNNLNNLKLVKFLNSNITLKLTVCSKSVRNEPDGRPIRAVLHIAGMGIAGVGKTTSQLVLKRYYVLFLY